MKTRLAAAAAALVLTAGTLAPPAFAQSYNAPAGIPAAVAPGGFADRVVGADDDLTTGSIGYGRGRSSAQQGNAEQNSFPVWQYGRTSGGPAR